MTDTVLVVTQQQQLIVQGGPVPSTLVQQVTQQQVLQTSGSQGPPGAQGPQGIPGTADLNYHYSQGIASAVWTINHNLGKYPSVTVIDSAGSQVEGALAYNGPNQLTITFSSPFSGDAYLN